MASNPTAKTESTAFEFQVADNLVWIGGVTDSGAPTWIAAKPMECAEVVNHLMTERDGLRAALRRIAANSDGLVRRAATQALEGRFA